MLPSVYHGSSCCFLQSTKSLTPSHTPFALPTGATDTADPSGWLYTLVGVLFSDPETTLPSNNFSAMWTGQSFGFPYSGCPYTICDDFTPSAAGATAVQSQAYLFAVRIITTSGVDLLSLASSIPTSSPPVTSGVEADPTSAAPTSNPETSSLPSFSLFMQTSLPQSTTANAHQTVSMAVETVTLITKSMMDMSLPPGIFGSQVETKPSTYVITESATGAATTVSGSVISLGRERQRIFLARVQRVKLLRPNWVVTPGARWAAAVRFRPILTAVSSRTLVHRLPLLPKLLLSRPLRPPSGVSCRSPVTVKLLQSWRVPQLRQSVVPMLRSQGDRVWVWLVLASLLLV